MVRIPSLKGLLFLGLLLVPLIILFLVNLINSSILQASLSGEDDRIEVFEEPDPQIRELADSTVMLMPKDLTFSNNKYHIDPNRTLQKELNMCPSERFINQPAVAFCSGTLISDRIIVTAGHCLKKFTSDICKETSIIFGFHMQDKQKAITSFDPDDVYHCRRIIDSATTTDYNIPDWLFIELDRKVKKYKPLPLNWKESLKIGTEVFAIGHPHGLPTKIMKGIITYVSPIGLFKTDIDTFKGSSGSSIFNSKTYKIEGVLVRGEPNDTVEEGSCKINKKCYESSCISLEGNTSPSFVHAIDRPLLTIDSYSLIEINPVGAANNAIDHNELTSLNIKLSNFGFRAANNVKVELISKTTGVEVLSKKRILNNLPFMTDVMIEDLRFKVKPSISCGDTFNLVLNVTYTDTFDDRQKEERFHVQLNVGAKKVQLLAQSSSNLNLPIPNNPQKSVTSKIVVSNMSNLINMSNSTQSFDKIIVPIDINHTFMNELVISLTAPNGNSILLHDEETLRWIEPIIPPKDRKFPHKYKMHPENKISGAFGNDFFSSENLSQLKVTDPNGTCTLNVKDTDAEED